MPFGDGTGPIWGFGRRGGCFWGLWAMNDREYLLRIKEILELRLKEINKRLEELNKNNA